MAGITVTRTRNRVERTVQATVEPAQHLHDLGRWKTIRVTEIRVVYVHTEGSGWTWDTVGFGGSAIGQSNRRHEGRSLVSFSRFRKSATVGPLEDEMPTWLRQFVDAHCPAEAPTVVAR